jgi:hypothetical protein
VRQRLLFDEINRPRNPFRSTSSEMVFGHPGGAAGANTDLNIYPGVGWVAAVPGNYSSHA